MTDLIGQTLSHYHIIEEIGRGGMATIYRAHHPLMDRDVAIKVLPPQFTQDPTFMARFEREIQLAAQLQHPHILPVFDFGEYEGMPYFVMAYMPRGTLEELLAQELLTLDQTLQYISQIAEGLDYLHQQGVIHRDLKISNILLDADDNVYLTDFGIAKVQEATAHLTGTGFVGTPSHMAPEMFTEGEVSPLVDIYALGVILYQLLTGELPFQADTPVQFMQAHLEQPVPNLLRKRPDLPAPVQGVLNKAMAKDPTQRFQSAEALFVALDNAASHEVTVSIPKQARSPWMWVAVAAAVLLVIGAILMFGWGKLKESMVEETEVSKAPPTEVEAADLAPLEASPTPALLPTPTITPSLTPTTEPIPIIGGGTGILGFNMDELGYTIDVSCAMAENVDCDSTPHILPMIGDLNPTFGQWSPDGSQFVYTAATREELWGTGYYLTYVVSYPDMEITVLNPESNSYNPVWSPDGKQLAFISDGDIHISDLSCQDEKDGTCIAHGELVFAYSAQYEGRISLIYGWLPDDRLIIRNPELAQDPWGGPGDKVAGFGLYTIDIKGGNLQYYLGVDFSTGLSFISGTSYVVSREGLQYGPYTYRITDVSSGTSWAILQADNTWNEIVTSPDGQYMAYIWGSDLAIVDLSCIENGFMGCQDHIRLVSMGLPHGSDWSFSPDSKWLAVAKPARVETYITTECSMDSDGTINENDCQPTEASLAKDIDIYLIDVEKAVKENGTYSEIVHQITFVGFGETPNSRTGAGLAWQPSTTQE